MSDKAKEILSRLLESEKHANIFNVHKENLVPDIEIAIRELAKLTTDRDALLKVAKYAVIFLDPKEVDVEWIKAAIAQAKEK